MNLRELLGSPRYGTKRKVHASLGVSLGRRHGQCMHYTCFLTGIIVPTACKTFVLGPCSQHAITMVCLKIALSRLPCWLARYVADPAIEQRRVLRESAGLDASA